MFRNAIIILSLLIICLNQNSNSNNEFDYENESFFAVIGITGSGKSEFINALAGEKVCEVSNKAESKTKEIQIVELLYKNNKFNVIDTPGLDDSKNNTKNIELIKNLLDTIPKIKKLLLIKHYNDVRFPESLQNALQVYMKAFPLKNFWEHVIVVNTYANPGDETFRDFMEQPHEKYIEKILNCDNLIEFMKNNSINIPEDIKEYYVDSIKYIKYSEINDTLNKIKEDILLSKPMFKNIEESPILQATRRSEKNNGFYIVKNYINITYTDFDGKKIYKEKIINEEEVVPKDYPIIKVEEKVKFVGLDLKFSDIFLISKPSLLLIRKFITYEYYIINYYKVGDKIIKGDPLYQRTQFVSITDEIFETLLHFVDNDTLKYIAEFLKKMRILPKSIANLILERGILGSEL